MTTEKTETVHVVTDLPASKQKIRNPFAKKDSAAADTTETETRKGKALHGVYAVGVMLLAAGAVGAVASKLGRKTDVEDDVILESTTETDN